MADQQRDVRSTKRPLKVGIVLQHWTSGRGIAPSWAEMQERALHVEAAGFDSLWLVDHLMFRRRESTMNRQADTGQVTTASAERPEWVGVWECWTILSALAAVTSRLELGTLVTCTAYRNPALLAKIADTVDEISGGRVVLGLGAGDHESEFATFGYPWDRRVSRFEEALHIVVPLLREGRVDFEGMFYQARECELRPRGPRTQGPPILIGARVGSPRMLRLCATHADQWNGWIAYGRSDPDEVAPMREAVDNACYEVGRDPSTLGRTLTVGAAMLGRRLGSADALSGSPVEIAEKMRGFAAEGINHLQIYLHPNTIEGIDALVPALELLDKG